VATTFFLIRHGSHSLLGTTLAGRMAHVHLNPDGRQQAQRLAERLAGERIDLICASPMERAQETATPIAERLALPLETADAVTEVDFGAWTGRDFDDLASDPHWTCWNEARAVTRPPGGETLLDVQHRALGYLESLRTRLPEGRAVIVSHGDVIRPILAYHLGISLDPYDKIEIAPGSLSALVVGDWGSRILLLNEVPVG
jgi:broad specificity phosphatase PhoE